MHRLIVVIVLSIAASLFLFWITRGKKKEDPKARVARELAENELARRQLEIGNELFAALSEAWNRVGCPEELTPGRNPNYKKGLYYIQVRAKDQPLALLYIVIDLKAEEDQVIWIVGKHQTAEARPFSLDEGIEFAKQLFTTQLYPITEGATK